MNFKSVRLGNSNATLDLYLCDPTVGFTRKAILVIPGGGYSCVCSDREGEPIAQAFIPYGYNAFVLHYTTDCKTPFPVQLTEATLAMAHIRENAKEYNINPEQVFCVGFSAGAHLAGSLATMWHRTDLLGSLGLPEGINKPTGAMLIYPVINRHEGSFRNLLCMENPTEEELRRVTLDTNVDKKTTPVFLAHTATDQVVPVSNSLDMAAALSKAGIRFELHIYPLGPHGLALANPITNSGGSDPYSPGFADWVALAADWANQL